MEPTAEQGLTIDELAREAGLTARNIRAYQSRGLVAPPEIRARTGYYAPAHVTRLRRIRELQEQGFNLRAIKRLLDLSEAGAAEALSFRSELLGAFGSADAEVISAADLEERFGGRLDSDLVRRAEKLGALRRLDSDRFEVTNPTLVSAATELVELGIPLRHALAVGDAVARHSRAIAREFVRLFVQDVLGPLRRDGNGSGTGWAQARQALERLSPLAGDAVLASFQQAMAAAVEREVQRRGGA
jgi:DNA-binding transcriptional MerR regulator